MSKISNIEVIEKFIKYFMKQDKELICRLLANMMIDINRIYNIEQLDKEEYECLMKRIKLNVDNMNKFIENGSDEPLTMGSLK